MLDVALERGWSVDCGGNGASSVRHNSSSDSGAANTAVQNVEEEHFVDAAVAAAFLSITRKVLA